MKNIFSYLIAAGLLLASNPALAGPDENARDAALTEAAKLRADGWPKERCYAGVRFFNNIVAEGNGLILARDTLVSINSSNVERLNTQQIADLLSSIPPNGVVVVQVRRDGQVLKLEQPCSNTADFQRPYLMALDFAGKKKWPECIDALAGRPDDLLYLNLRARCAQVSRKPEAYPIQQWLDRKMQGTVALGVFAPDARRELALSLLKSRIELSPQTYDALVRQVRDWDEGRTWDSLQPDIAVLRRAAEQGVKRRLIDPQSAIIEMPYDFMYGSWTPAFSGVRFEGFMTCGSVNAKNRMGGYTGSTSFVAVVDENGTEKYTDMDSGTSQYFRPVDAGCAQLVKKLKVASSVIESGVTGTVAPAAPPSMAEELEKLAKLHDSGALNDAEYATAKSKVLSGKR